MIEVKFFHVEEFDSKGEPGTGNGMRISTLLKLDKARADYKKRITINHGFRTSKAAKRIKKNYPGAVDKSSHELGFASDLRPTDVTLQSNNWDDWKELLDSLWVGGFRRFGIMGHAIHVDDDPARSAPYIWDYEQTPSLIWAKAQQWFKEKTK